MKTRQLVGAALAMGVLAAAVWAQTPAPPAARMLKLTVNYTGTATVNSSHKVAVLLFDSPDYQSGSVAPVSVLAAERKQQTFTIPVEQATLYAVAVFDPNGDYQGFSLPPNGARLGLYGRPIQTGPGKTTEVTLAFDDSVKWPIGGAQ